MEPFSFCKPFGFYTNNTFCKLTKILHIYLEKIMSNISTYSSVPTYQKLVEAVQVFLNRYDQDTLDMIPFFINAAEKTILRNLRMPAMEKMVCFTLEETSGDLGYVDIPMDYLEMKYVWVDGSTLQRVTFDQLVDHDNNNERYGYPCGSRAVWAMNATRMYIRGLPLCKEIYMTYYADIPEISKDTPSNVLLDLAPDAFLYFAVAEGFRFLMEEGKSDYWTNQANQRLMEIKQQVQDAEFSGSPLVISPLGFGG